jgi:hypothetical protein
MDNDSAQVILLAIILIAILPGILRILGFELIGYDRQLEECAFPHVRRRPQTPDNL